MAEKITYLRIEAPRSGTVAETAECLTRLEMCYRQLCIFYAWVEESRVASKRRQFSSPPYWYPDSSLDVFPYDTPLRISAVQLQSPGFWEFLGSLNPLETIRRYLKDRHERRKDRQWRESSESERRQLENELLRTKLVNAQIGLLKKVGVPKSMIRRLAIAHIIRPLTALDRFQDSGLIGSATPSSLPQPPFPTDTPKRRITLEDD